MFCVASSCNTKRAVCANTSFPNAPKQRFTSKHDLLRLDQLRSACDAVLVGAETIRVLNPPLHIRDEKCLKNRVFKGLAKDLIHVVPTKTGNLDLQSRAFSKKYATTRVIATTIEGRRKLEGPPDPGLNIWDFDADHVPLIPLLSRLADLGIGRLLVEGGAKTNWHFFKAGLVDELFVTIAPCVLGGRSALGMVEGPEFSVQQCPRLALQKAEQIGNELYCHYVANG